MTYIHFERKTESKGADSKQSEKKEFGPIIAFERDDAGVAVVCGAGAKTRRRASRVDGDYESLRQSAAGEER